MSNVLDKDNIGKDTTRFTIFESDQVLTADQLNDLFNYLDVQTRLTRTRAIGVGIICGLEIGTLENKNIIVSKGAAITTDGDMLHLDEDQEFDQYEIFEDVNAKYPYFKGDNDQVIPVFELRNSRAADAVAGKQLSAFEEITATVFKDYAGVLYLEDYKNDPDIWTGTDCDNKGAEAAKELKVLLVHKTNMKKLLQSMPPLNKNYFEIDDIHIPRVSIQNTIDTYAELNAAFNNTLVVKEELKNKLSAAYQACKPIVEDEFDGTDPTTTWNALLDQHFNVGTTIYSQYVYDFARDIGFAYNEMRETLFSGNMMCCPDVELFPKHVLLGLVQTATVSRIPDSPISSPIAAPLPDRPFFGIRNPGLSLFRPIRFDIGLLIKRFTKKIDLEYRHYFYESPVLNNKDEDILQTRFCFTRINSLIKNFKVPTAEELQNVTQSIKVTPSYFEDRPLGERSIPFYYRYDTNLPVNLYWNYKANVRKKENEILYYSASQYFALNPVSFRSPTVNPLQFSILPYNFFRVEGHIGFDQAAAETALNNVIQEHNLPFNVLCVQVERNILTIPRKPWYFRDIALQDALIKNRFFDSLNQADVVNTDLKTQAADLPEASDINLAVENYGNAKSKVMSYTSFAQPDFNIEGFKTDVQSMISATAEVKVRTKQFDFAQTAVPHDFVINTDIVNKAVLISDLIKQRETKKLEDLMLGNFMKQNSGLEHAGGVLRGGTFVLVYTSNDKKVVADFMLPYYVADKDVIPDPPVFKPLPLPLPGGNPVFGKIFKKTPFYLEKIDLKIKEKIDPLDLKFDTKINERFSGFDTKINEFNQKSAALETKFTVYDKVLLDKVASPGINSRTVPNPAKEFAFGDKDLTPDVDDFRLKQKALAELALDAPDRKEKELALVEAGKNLAGKLNQADIAGNQANATVVKSVLSDMHAGAGLIQDAEVKAQAAEVTNLANNINKGFLNR